MFFGMTGGADHVWCKGVGLSVFTEGLGRYSGLDPPELRMSSK